MRPTAEVAAPTRAAWRRWLQRNHASGEGVWLILTRKGSGIRSVSYDEAVEEALCFGWIDATVQSLDDERRRQLFTPRKKKSMWSASNKQRVARLIASGRMTEAGLAAIERAKADGTWAMGEEADRLVVPADLARALKASGGRRNFDGFSPSVRRGILYWIADARRPETRARRIDKAASMAARNLRALVDDDS